MSNDPHREDIAEEIVQALEDAVGDPVKMYTVNTKELRIEAPAGAPEDEFSIHAKIKMHIPETHYHPQQARRLHAMIMEADERAQRVIKGINDEMGEVGITYTAIRKRDRLLSGGKSVSMRYMDIDLAIKPKAAQQILSKMESYPERHTEFATGILLSSNEPLCGAAPRGWTAAEKDRAAAKIEQLAVDAERADLLPHAKRISAAANDEAAATLVEDGKWRR